MIVGTVDWATDEMVEAMLALVAAIEKQDLTAVELDITARVPRQRKPRQGIGKFFGCINVFEQEV